MSMAVRGRPRGGETRVSRALSATPNIYLVRGLIGYSFFFGNLFFFGNRQTGCCPPLLRQDTALPRAKSDRDVAYLS